jgi:predicted DNA-binding antitoxin AbrB/MazE fold protein
VSYIEAGLIRAGQTMIQSLEAIFDGEVFQPEVPLDLKAGTRVRIIVESVVPDGKQPKSFLQTAQSLRLEGYFRVTKVTNKA